MNSGGIDPGVVARSGGLTIGGLFCQAVALYPNDVAIVDQRSSVTYAELNVRVNRLANMLAGRGLFPGDRIAILSENRREFVELEMATAKLGVILACQNWRQSDAELTYCIALAAPKLVFASEALVETIARLGCDVPAVVFGDQYERLLGSASEREPPDSVDGEAGAIILYTSGTTGMPKGALISHRAEIARSIIARADYGLDPRRTFIAWSPLFHIGSTDSVYTTLMGGGKVVIMESLNVSELVEWTTREVIGHLTLMPGMVDRVIAEFRRTGVRPKDITACGHMADLVPRHQIAEITTLLQAPYRNSFGSTETGNPPAGRGMVPIGVVPERLSKLQNSFCRIRLVDTEDREVPVGEPGELTIRGPTLFSGYWQAPETNAEDFRGGWFHMGDVFVRNPDGTLDFVDRRKYLIKSGGENIYPAEIENALRTSPRISEAVVVRKPDARWGEVPVAFVVRNDENLTVEEVVSLCRERIASFKTPKEVFFVADEDLPRSATGKIKRHELESELKARAAAAV